MKTLLLKKIAFVHVSSDTTMHFFKTPPVLTHSLNEREHANTKKKLYAGHIISLRVNFLINGT